MTVHILHPKTNPPRQGRWPFLTLALALAIVGVFVWQDRLDSYRDAQVVYSFGVVPAHLFGIRMPAPQIDVIPPALSLLTAQFLHGGWVHLIGNVLVLLLLGPIAERGTGRVRYMLVFFGAGVLGLAVEAAASPTSTVPIIGASAAIAGLIGAVARRDPWAKIALPAPRRGHWTRSVSVPALPIIVVWLFIQLYGLAFAEGETVNSIAFLAHGVGFVSGVLLAGPWRRANRTT